MPGLDTEVELKLRLLMPAARQAVFDAPALAALLTAPPCEEHLETWYFDTADGDLQDAGLAYRIRLEDGRWTATVKADEAAGGGLHQRREWNVAIDGPEPRYEYFRTTEAGPLLADAGGGEPLVPRFSTIFDRRRADVVVDGSRIEAAVDLGTIFAGGREEAIAEVELELKEGSPAAVLALGAALVRQVPLAVEPRSKYYRALALAGLAEGLDPLVVPPLAPDETAAPGVRTLIAARLGAIFAAYEAFTADREAAAAVHRLRVQLRRLRSLLALAKPLVAPADYERWQGELGALSQATHRLREADVTDAAWAEMTAACPPLTPPPWLGLMLATERRKLAAEADEALGQGGLTATLLAFWAWVADGRSLRQDEALLEDFAAARLAGWLEELRANGKEIDLRDAAALHRLRIEGKRLRYALESLPLADSRRAKVMIARLKALQDCLGQLHDSLLAGAAMDGWLRQHASRVVHRDAGLLIGWMARQGVAATAEFAPAWKRFKRAARRWQKEL